MSDILKLQKLAVQPGIEEVAANSCTSCNTNSCNKTVVEMEN